MEELRKLEQIQRTLSFMQSRSLVTSSCSNSHDSNRFLANLILLLVQPCGKLDMDDKCRLILKHVPKLSSSFLEEALLWLSQEDSQNNCIASDIVVEENYRDPLLSNNDDLAMVGLDAMQRANSTLEDFCRSYFMFHGMDANCPQAIFKYLPELSFTESFIYQLDSMNEKIVDIPTNGVTLFERDFEVVVLRTSENQSSKLMNVVKNDPFRTLVSLLEQHGLLTERIREEFRCGEEYWALERKLCCALKSNKEISVKEAMRAIHLKSFDYRVLNLLLYQLRGEKVNDLHMEFLSISEFLVEISDDLFDYEDDVLENNFNILRMFVRIYGPSTAPTMLAKYITEAEEKYDNILKSLDPQLSSNYRRRCEEATKEGGKISEHPLGTWSIPPLIVDEESYRSNLLNL
ncbi:ATP synthase subunit B [Melia azedarach]|uniref:ATP synthase subunit B n=1 Tax=Melia azedarach TaxID=155640 RepID=A0ACC1XSI5_MELAZ|nr:ATP synthase subunit B [Melia azedarach]